MGEGDEAIERRDEAFARHELGEGRSPVEGGNALGRNEPLLAPGPGDEHAAFLERLADRGDLGPRQRIGRF